MWDVLTRSQYGQDIEIPSGVLATSRSKDTLMSAFASTDESKYVEMFRVQDVDQQDLDALKGAQWLSGAELPSRIQCQHVE